MKGNRTAPKVLPDGTLVGPDGTEYRRTEVRIKRKLGDSLASAGAAVVTSVYPEGLRWYDGPAALEKWRLIRPRLVEGKKPPVRDLQWLGHLWESDSGLSLLYFTGEH